MNGRSSAGEASTALPASRSMDGSLFISAPAKINLYLGVHAQKDERGYHTVDSVMTMLDLADLLTIAPSDELAVRTEPAADFPQEHNTAYKAAVAMGEAFGREPRFDILIEKHIPIRAGLGGPSTDAAATILAIARFWGIDPHDERIDAVAASIGADVPFFLYGPPAYLDGRGDAMREMFQPLADVSVALVKPRESSVSTIEAYRRFDEEPAPLPPLAPMLDALRAGDVDAVCAHIENNLASAACDLAPEIGEILDWMSERPGVRAANVCGSGATVFAICSAQAEAQAIADAAERGHGWWSYAAKTGEYGPGITADWHLAR